MNNYKRRDSVGRTDKDHDILGIVLMIISAFLLLCSAIPVIFGPVSSAIQAVCLGLFGIFAYALFAFVFAIGLVLLLRRKISVSAKKIIAIAGIAVFLMVLLQLITTNSVLSESFGDYISEVYANKWTAGGIIFGLIAYGIKALISVVGAYIVVSLLLAGFIALLVYFIIKDNGLLVIKRNPAKHKTSGEPEQLSIYNDEEDTLEQRVDKSNNAASLFVAKVSGNGFERENGTSRESTYGLYDDYGQLNIMGRKRYSQEEAADILYKSFETTIEDPIKRGNKRQEEEADVKGSMGRGYYEGTEEEQPNVRPAPASAEASPDIHEVQSDERKKPKKILHDSPRANNGFSNLTLPTIKSPERENDDGNIMNSNAFESISGNTSNFAAFGNEAGSGFTRGEDSQNNRDNQETRNFGDVNSRNFNSYMPPNNAAENDDSGIISADSWKIEAAEEQDVKPGEGESESRKSGYDGYGGLDKASFGITNRNIAENDSPIANARWFGNVYEETEDEDDGVGFKPFIIPENPKNDDRVFTSFSDAPPITNMSTFEKMSNKADVHGTVSDHSDDCSNNKTEENVKTEEGNAEKDQNPIISDVKPVENNDGNDLIIDNEVEDKTEQAAFEGEDHTGYYTHEEPQVVEEVKPQPPVKEVIHSTPANDTRLNETVKEPEPQPIPPAADEPYIYIKPPLNLLSEPEEDSVVDSAEIEGKTQAIEEILNGLKFPAKVCNVIVGPSVTRFELQPPQGIPVRRILALDKDLELTLASGAIRIEAPVANKQVVGVEVANKHPVSVALREIIDSPAFKDSRGMLPLALGKDIGGDAIVRNLEKMPHLLVAGATNMGKSVCLNTIIISLIYKNSPEDVRLVLVDPKHIEFTPYRGLPHLLLENPITEVNHAVNALNYLIDEMEKRYELFNSMAQSGYAIRNLEEYNKCDLVRSGKAKKIPYIVMIVDELADLMTTRKKDVENGIRRIAQKARAAGIHLVLATQRPSVDIITGSIKVNLPSRISLKVTSNADSRTVLDQGGAESLIGRGDMLLMCNSEPLRLQGAFLSNEEIGNIVSNIKQNNKAIFDKEIEKCILVDQSEPEEAVQASSDSEESADEKMLPNIMRCFINRGKASTSMIQTRFSFGYARAARIINILETRKWIGPPTMNAKARDVYMTVEQFETIFGEPFNE